MLNIYQICHKRRTITRAKVAEVQTLALAVLFGRLAPRLEVKTLRFPSHPADRQRPRTPARLRRLNRKSTPAPTYTPEGNSPQHPIHDEACDRTRQARERANALAPIELGVRGPPDLSTRRRDWWRYSSELPSNPFGGGVENSCPASGTGFPNCLGPPAFRPRPPRTRGVLKGWNSSLLLSCVEYARLFQPAWKLLAQMEDQRHGGSVGR